MKKLFLSIFIIIGVLVSLKILLGYMAQDYLSKKLKQNIEFKSFDIYPFKIKTTSLGGGIELTYTQGDFLFELDNVSLSSFEKINKTKTRKTMIVNKGRVDGNITYNPLTQVLTTNLKATDIIINGIDLDRKLLFYNDVLGFNIISLFKNYLKNLDNTNKMTKISHLQFNARRSGGVITLNDVALSSRNFRIALFGKLHQNGDILHFSAHLIHKNGCSIISQELTGNLKNPQLHKTRSFKKIVKAVPKSMFNTSMKMADFTKHSMHKMVPRSGQRISGHILTKSHHLLQKTSHIMMPQSCKKSYSGLVQHPKESKQGYL